MTASRHRRLARTGGHPPTSRAGQQMRTVLQVPSAARERALLPQ
jgi:hypothetical protein